MPRELAEAVEAADLDPSVHVIALSGNGKGFCGGDDLVQSAERGDERFGDQDASGSPLDPVTIAANHDPSGTWDPMVDYAMMRRNVRGFMSLFHADKPVVCKVHGFCVAGGTDMALCSDLLVIAADAKIGYPPGRVLGSPTPRRCGPTASAPSAPSACCSAATRCRAPRRSSGAWPSRRRPPRSSTRARRRS